MSKKLSEMSLEELWKIKLFPIFLTEHKDCWKKWFDERKREIRIITFAKRDCKNKSYWQYSS